MDQSNEYAYELIGDKGGFEQKFKVATEIWAKEVEGTFGSVEVKEKSDDGTKGIVVVGQGVSMFGVNVMLEADKKLTIGKETLELKVGGVTSGKVGFGDGSKVCAEGTITDVDGEGLCLPDTKTARFVYTVSVDPNVGSEQTYGYEFARENQDLSRL